MVVCQATAKSILACETLGRIARETLDATGAAVAFYWPDGSLLEGSSEFLPAADDASRLVVATVESSETRVEELSGRLVAAWPIRQRARTVLVAVAEWPLASSADADSGRRLLAAVARAVSADIDRKIIQEENEATAEALTQSFEEISLLHGLGKVLRVTHPVAELLERTCSELRETLGAEAIAAYLPKVEGMEPQTVIAGRLPFDASQLPVLVAHLLDDLGPEQTVVIINHCQEDPQLAAVSIALERLVLVPLPLREGVSGALMAVNRPAGEFGSPDAKLVRSITSSAAVFIENHRLYRDLQQLMLDLVRALVSSIDAKDPYTCGHSERVAITCREVARQMSLSDKEAEWAYMAGLLHDIGKIGTPEHILRKEGRLEPEELQIIHRHPVTGGRILEGVKRLEPVREAILYHHEHLDGSGYPDGLRGDQIPVLARIVGLADALDAMTSNRPYRPMLPFEHVKREIERNVGTQFDVRAVDALFSLDMNRLMRQFVERAPSGRTA
jgi:putative nucleotidyltransferase with HDIG domain